MLRHSLVFPDIPVMGEHDREACGNVDEWIAVNVTRFDQGDGEPGVFGEITRHHAAGGTCADNDNVVGSL